MDPVYFVRLANRAYHEREGSAGTIEYITDCYNGAKVYALRGTSRNKGYWGWLAMVRDLLHDSRVFIPRYHPELGWRPGGFLDSSVAMAAEIASQTQDKSEPIYLCGHSLAATTAFLVADILTRRGYNIAGVAGFDAPRGGKLNHIPNDHTEVLAIRHGGDYISMIPPWWGVTVKHQTVGKALKRFWKNHSIILLMDAIIAHDRNGE